MIEISTKIYAENRFHSITAKKRFFLFIYLQRYLQSIKRIVLRLIYID